MNHMRTIGSRKISGTSNGDAYAPQRTTVPEPLRSLVCGSPVGFAVPFRVLLKMKFRYHHLQSIHRSIGLGVKSLKGRSGSVVRHPIGEH